MVDQIEAAWAAGFFDGEGCFINRRFNGTTKIPYARVNISQADREVLDRFKAAVGNVGNVTGPYSRPPHKDMWYFQAASRHEVEQICKIIGPYLSSIKLEQMSSLLKDVEGIRHYTKRLTPIEISAIMNDYVHGATYKELAAKYSRSYQAIVKLISAQKRKYGV